LGRARVIPILLLKGKGLVKTVRFKNPTYVGDPINAVKIFNDKEVDELVLLDIDASKNNRKPDFELLRDIVSEAFMPVGYGGGIRTMQDVHRIFQSGIEKVILNSLLMDNEASLKEMVDNYGSQSIIACVDYKKNIFGKAHPFFFGGSKSIKSDVRSYTRQLEELGVGEIILQSIDRDGTFNGYDLEMIQSVANAVNIPVVAAGGAATQSDFKLALDKGASAVAAGSMFVYNGKHKAVLISYINNIS
jgi:cyclase